MQYYFVTAKFPLLWLPQLNTVKRNNKQHSKTAALSTETSREIKLQLFHQYSCYGLNFEFCIIPLTFDF